MMHRCDGFGFLGLPFQALHMSSSNCSIYDLLAPAKPLRFPYYVWRACLSVRVFWWSSVVITFIGVLVWNRYASVFILVIPLVVLTAKSLAKRIIRGLVTSASQCDWRTCLRCGYCLSHLASEHQCPECGETYDADILVRCWIAIGRMVP